MSPHRETYVLVELYLQRMKRLQLGLLGLLGSLTVFGPVIPGWALHAGAGVAAVLSYRVYSHHSKLRDLTALSVEETHTEGSASHQKAMLPLLDALTGLHNRRFLTTQLEVLGVTQEAYSVFFIDLDNFKKVNDTFGHQKGDELLIAVARTLKASLKKDDMVCRYGGDEFVLLLLDTDMTHISTICHRIIANLKDLSNRLGYASVDFGASVGVLINDTHVSPHEASAAADALMYKIKQGGKHGFAIQALSQLS